jgi:hypothetical protein
MLRFFFKRQLGLICPLWVLFVATAWGQTPGSDSSLFPPNPFSRIDAWARQCAQNKFTRIDSLAAALQLGASNDMEKARAIFVWLSESVTYDVDNLSQPEKSNGNAEAVLKGGKALCDGFSTLFHQLAAQMNLEVKTVNGYAKGYSYFPGKSFSTPNHSWNIVKIDGKWHIVDATWGQGFGSNENGKVAFVKHFDDYWFDVDPYAAIFNHLPDNKAHSLLDSIPDLRQYEKMQRVDPGFFKMGFDGATSLRSAWKAAAPPVLPQAYTLDIPVRVLKAPALAHLQTGRLYEFSLYIPDAQCVYFLESGKKPVRIAPENGYFHFMYPAETPGELWLGVQHSGSGGQADVFLQYKMINNLFYICLKNFTDGKLL